MIAFAKEEVKMAVSVYEARTVLLCHQLVLVITQLEEKENVNKYSLRSMKRKVFITAVS